MTFLNQQNIILTSIHIAVYMPDVLQHMHVSYATGLGQYIELKSV